MNVYKRFRGATATADTIEKVPSNVREQRVRHLIAQERSQRLEAARAGLLAAQEAHEAAKARVPETAAELEAAMAKLAEIKGEEDAA